MQLKVVHTTHAHQDAKAIPCPTMSLFASDTSLVNSFSCGSHQTRIPEIHPALWRWRWRARGRWSPSGWRIRPIALPQWKTIWRLGKFVQWFIISSPKNCLHLLSIGVGWSNGSKEESGCYWRGRGKSRRINFCPPFFSFFLFFFFKRRMINFCFPFFFNEMAGREDDGTGARFNGMSQWLTPFGKFNVNLSLSPVNLSHFIVFN